MRSPLDNASYYLVTASHDDAVSQANLAMMMTFGRDSPADAVEAFDWYLRAARQGDPQGLNGVGYSYLAGQGVRRERHAYAGQRVPARRSRPGYSYLTGQDVRRERHAYAGRRVHAWRSRPGFALHGVLLAVLAVRTYSPVDAMRPSAEAALEQIAALLSDELKTMLDADVGLFRPQAARAPE